MTIEKIIFYVLLVDAISSNIIIIFGRRWYVEHFRTLSRWFPPAPGWAIHYLLLMLWIGSLISRI